jgi:hypothetical protein
MSGRRRVRRHGRPSHAAGLLTLAALLSFAGCERLWGIGDTRLSEDVPTDSGAGGGTSQPGGGGGGERDTTAAGASGEPFERGGGFLGGGERGEWSGAGNAAGTGGAEPVEPGSGGIAGTADAAAPPGLDPHGSVRVDNLNHVVYAGSDHHIYELVLAELAWRWLDLTALTGAPLGTSPFGYARSDQVSSVVYRSDGQEIIELFMLLGGGWGYGDLTAISGAERNAGAPVGYVRRDRVNAVVYQDTAGGSVHEIALTGNWGHLDLFSLTGAPRSPGKPFAFVRSDGVDSLLYGPDKDRLSYELAHAYGGWSWTSLGKNVVDGSAYLRDNITTLLYRNPTDQHLYESVLDNGDWAPPADLTAITGAPAILGRPYGVVREDGIRSIIFRGSDDHLQELALLGGGWQYTADLTVVTGCQPLQGDGVPYLRSDGATAIVFGASGQIYELLLSRKGANVATWSCNDLTAIATPF